MANRRKSGRSDRFYFLGSKIIADGKYIPGGTGIKNLPATAGDLRDAGSIPGLERSPGGGRGSPLQHSCLENPMDGGAWRAIVHGVAKSQTQLSN